MKKTFIRCRWQETGRILVNPDGQVWPCCYLCNKSYKSEQLGVYGPNNQVDDMTQEGENWFWKESDEIMREYKRNAADLNLKNKTFKEIVNHEWYTKTLPESWEKEETRLEQCRQFCEVTEDEMEDYNPHAG
jgi:hypothetical protein